MAMNGKRCLAMLTLLLGSSVVWGGDWPHWRGPERNGICREKGLVDTWSYEPKTHVLWESKIGGRSTPIVLNGRVYINCRSEHDVTDPKQLPYAGQQVVCFDAETGEVLWRHEFNVSQTDIPGPRVGWAAMVGDPETEYVFVHTVDSWLRCYDRDGKVIWERSLLEEFGEITGYGGRVQTPIIDEDRLIISFLAANWGDTKGPAKHYYYAFAKKTGELVWVSAPGGRPNDTIYSCPTVAVINGQRMLIGGNGDGGIYAVNARTGKPIWGFQMSRRGLNASVVVAGNYVYASHGEDNVDNNEYGRIQCIDATGTGDVTKTHSVWRIDGIKADYPSPLVHDGILYVVSDNAKLLALDARTGQRFWEHDLGTVGKGSPVWADGKLYIMEVNGRIHILQPTRESCTQLSLVQLKARDGNGDDEIYASPAIANGRIYFLTRDRLVCVGKKDYTVASDPIPALPQEKPCENQIAHLQLVPFETSVMAGGSVAYTLRAYDQNGRFIKNLSAPLVPKGLNGATIQGMTVITGVSDAEQAGTVTAKAGKIETSARLRVFPALPWKWTFDGYKEKQTPMTWIGAFGKLNPFRLEHDTVLMNRPGPGKPSGTIWIGRPTMSGYTIQADVMLVEQKRRLSSVGVTANRYNLILAGNTNKLSIQDWAPHFPVKEVKYRVNSKVWYTMKLRVDVESENARIRGKVWQRDQSEPDDWTIEAVDPRPISQGSPGLYYYALGDAYFDNVVVSKSD
jgi:outer membrane protein assembly factor BamB